MPKYFAYLNVFPFSLQSIKAVVVKTLEKINFLAKKN